MGCFGRCGCAECCMSATEIDSIATSVTINGPNLADYEVELIDDGCCHYATIPIEQGYTDYCEKVAERITTETATVSNKILEHQKYTASWQVTADTPEGNCVFLNDNPPSPSNTTDACTHILNCGTTLEEYESITELYFAVRYRYTEVNVAIYKRLMICPPSEELVCKYVVECTIGYEVQVGGGRYDSFTRTYTHSNKHECCVEICDEGKPNHDPAFDCDTDVVYGNPAEYTMTAVRIYDTAEDIPETIIFDEPYETIPCVFEFCVDTANPPEAFHATNTGLECPDEVGSIETFTYEGTCFYCYDTSLSCEDGVLHTNVGDNPDCNPLPAGFGCDCETGDRFNGRNLSRINFSLPQSFSYQTLKNVDGFSYHVSGEGCHEYPDQPRTATCEACELVQPFEGIYPGILITDRNACNWWDCSDCYFDGSDPIILPYQNWNPNVDAYFFECIENQYTPQQEFIIPFPYVSITRNV